MSYFVGNSVFPCHIVVLYNTKQTIDRLWYKQTREKPETPPLPPLNIFYLFCEVRYGWSSLIRRIIVSASQAPFCLSNSALWRFFNGQMIKGGEINPFLLLQGMNCKYATSA